MDFKKFLDGTMVASFGCTEPIALAYAAAEAHKLFIGQIDDIEEITVNCSGNIIKNVFSVTVPGTDGQKGIQIAAVVGAMFGDPSLKLEVLSVVKKEDLPKANAFIEAGKCKVKLVKDVPNLYIDVLLKGREHSAQVILADSHTNIIKKIQDGKIVFQAESKAGEEKTAHLELNEIFEFITTLSDEKLKEFEPKLEQEIAFNKKICQAGLNEDWGSCIGQIIMKDAETFEERATAWASAGADARMSGCELPVVINSGSGNQGITSSIPVIIYAEENNIEKKELYKALLLSALLGEFMKQGIGKLSAYCGVVSAATASVAGIAFLNKEDRQIINDILTNALAVNSGMFCDGAKPSCAMKIASSLRNAFLAYKQAKNNKTFQPGDGIVGKDIDETLLRISNIARYGMKPTDEVIIGEMINDRSYKDHLKA